MKRETKRKGAGGVRKVGEERAESGISKVAGSGKNRGKLCNIAQYFTIETAYRVGSQQI